MTHHDALKVIMLLHQIHDLTKATVIMVGALMVCAVLFAWAK